MDDDIRTLEKMRDDLLRQVSALDFAINTLQQIRDNLTHVAPTVRQVPPNDPARYAHQAASAG